MTSIAQLRGQSVELMSMRTDRCNSHNVQKRRKYTGKKVLKTCVGQFKNRQYSYNWGARRRKQSKWD